MLAASYWSLLAPAIEIAEESDMYGPHGRWAFVPAAVGFALGAGAMLFTEKLLPMFGLGAKPESWEKKDDDYERKGSPRQHKQHDHNGMYSFIQAYIKYSIVKIFIITPLVAQKWAAMIMPLQPSCPRKTLGVLYDPV
jgi:zinc transporter ZupT